MKLWSSFPKWLRWLLYIPCLIVIPLLPIALFTVISNDFGDTRTNLGQSLTLIGSAVYVAIYTLLAVHLSPNNKLSSAWLSYLLGALLHLVPLFFNPSYSYSMFEILRLIVWLLVGIPALTYFSQSSERRNKKKILKRIYLLGWGWLIFGIFYLPLAINNLLKFKNIKESGYFQSLLHNNDLLNLFPYIEVIGYLIVVHTFVLILFSINFLMIKRWSRAALSILMLNFIVLLGILTLFVTYYYYHAGLNFYGPIKVNSTEWKLVLVTLSLLPFIVSFYILNQGKVNSFFQA